MADKKISQLTANTNPSGGEELVYAYNNTNGKMSLNTMKAFVGGGKQDTLVSGVNIKTINHKSILGSGNINIEGGGGGGGEEIIELEYDANIRELEEGIYTTTHDLYYRSGHTVPVVYDTGTDTCKQMLFVIKEATGQRSYFFFNEGHISSDYMAYAGYGYSVSSSVGGLTRLEKPDAAFKYYEPALSQTAEFDNLTDSGSLSQYVTDLEGTSTLTVGSGTLYKGATYTLVGVSVASGENYTVSLGTGITNPLNITLPSASTKPCVITLYATSTTTAIITGCTIGS